MLCRPAQIATLAWQIDRSTMRCDAAYADAVVHGAPCLLKLTQPGPQSVPVESDMPLHLRTRLACTRDLIAMRSPFRHRQYFPMTFGLCAVWHQAIRNGYWRVDY